MKNDMTIEEMMAELNAQMAWFHGDKFRLEEARERFIRARQLANDIEKVLAEMKNDIEVLSEDFGREQN